MIKTQTIHRPPLFFCEPEYYNTLITYLSGIIDSIIEINHFNVFINNQNTFTDWFNLVYPHIVLGIAPEQPEGKIYEYYNSLTSIPGDLITLSKDYCMQRYGKGFK